MTEYVYNIYLNQSEILEDCHLFEGRWFSEKEKYNPDRAQPVVG